MARLVTVMAYEVELYKRSTNQCWYQWFETIDELRDYLRLVNHHDELTKSNGWLTMYAPVVVTDIRGPQPLQKAVKDPE